MFYMVGLASEDGLAHYTRFRPAASEVWREKPRKDPLCSECCQTQNSQLARGDPIGLPTKVVSQS